MRLAPPPPPRGRQRFRHDNSPTSYRRVRGCAAARIKRAPHSGVLDVPAPEPGTIHVDLKELVLSTELYTDSKAARDISYNPEQHERMKPRGSDHALGACMHDRDGQGSQFGGLGREPQPGSGAGAPVGCGAEPREENFSVLGDQKHGFHRKNGP